MFSSQGEGCAYLSVDAQREVLFPNVSPGRIWLFTDEGVARSQGSNGVALPG